VEVEVPLEGLPPELDGFTILHLSDFHLGKLSLNDRTLERAVAWTEGQEADVVALTGDLLSRRRGEDRLRAVLGRLRARHGTFAVLGNHDIAAVENVLGPVLLADSSATFAVDGRRVQVVGCDPQGWKSRRPERLADPRADLRILLAHFPDVAERLAPGIFQLVLAGHLHGGQICLPTPRGKVRLAHVRARYWEGLHATAAGMLYVSRGLGTTFVPFRFLARPEATRLTLRGLGKPM
jgi:predicted MPP superfamily phosphohydrolase